MEFVGSSGIDIDLLQFGLNTVRRPRRLAGPILAVDRRSVKLGNEWKHGVAVTVNPRDVGEFVQRAAGQQAVQKTQIINEKFFDAAGTNAKVEAARRRCAMNEDD